MENLGPSRGSLRSCEPLVYVYKAPWRLVLCTAFACKSKTVSCVYVTGSLWLCTFCSGQQHIRSKKAFAYQAFAVGGHFKTTDSHLIMAGGHEIDSTVGWNTRSSDGAR